MESMNTLSKQKRITCVVLLVLLAILAVMSVYGWQLNDDVFIILALAHLLFSIDYLHSYIKAFPVLTFGDDELILTRGKKKAVVKYADIVQLREMRWGYIYIDFGEKKRYLTHGEFYKGMSTLDPKRTVNQIRDAVEEKYGKVLEIQYK
jgi:hypothetical protein